MKKIVVFIIVLLSLSLYIFWGNDNTVITIPHRVTQASLVHTTGSLHFDEIYICSDEKGDSELYKKLEQQGKKCNNNFPTTITCDMQCTDVTGVAHYYAIPERNFSFELQYDNRTSAYDFLQDAPTHYLFTLSGNILTENISYDTSLSPQNTIIYTEMDTSYDKLLNDLRSKGYTIEDYTKELNNIDNNIVAYWISDRSIVNNTMPNERIYVFHHAVTGYFYNVSKDILSYDCNPGPCSSLSNITFFKN